MKNLTNMKNLTIFSILLLLTLLNCNCARQNKTVQIDSEFVPYVAEFQEQANNHGVHIKIDDLIVKFDDAQYTGLKGQRFINGLCVVNSNQPPTVYVNEQMWSAYNEMDKLELIMHELSHCVLYKPHNNTVVNGVPVSIMNEWHLGKGLFNENTKEKYISELFSN
jgi:hypothetical protein